MVLDKFYAKNFHGEELFRHKFGGFVEYGNQIYSRYKIFRGEEYFVQGNYTYVTNWDNFPEEDYRNVQVVDLEINKQQRVRVINYHGIWSKNKQGNEETLRACELIHKFGTEVTYPTIVCGDFNLFPDTESMQVFSDDFTNLIDLNKVETTRLESNELSSKKRNVVDYILVSKDVDVKDFKVVKSDVSDHLPLMLEFDIK
jgi:endonuclease/exonuclease/phosphatase family metal-dependent hydrolase